MLYRFAHFAALIVTPTECGEIIAVGVVCMYDFPLNSKGSEVLVMMFLSFRRSKVNITRLENGRVALCECLSSFFKSRFWSTIQRHYLFSQKCMRTFCLLRLLI